MVQFTARYGASLARWLVTLAILIGAPIYLAYRPNDYTPFVQILLSLILFCAAYWIGNKKELDEARQRANDRWLPQAESVIFRLMTLHSNVRRFSASTKANCSRSECELPELQQQNMRAVKIKLRTDCGAAAQRLDDIAHQLEDAIEDWRRFVAANCTGDECLRIFQALEQRRVKLELEPEIPIPDQAHLSFKDETGANFNQQSIDLSNNQTPSI